MEERNFISSIEPKTSRALALHVERELRAFPEPRAKDRVGEIGFRLVQRGDREADRHGALSEARDLGKNEPHPEALLPPDLQLLANALVDRRLCVHEPLEIKRVRYLRLLRTAATFQGGAQFRLRASGDLRLA
jgi:hypothetical protein